MKNVLLAVRPVWCRKILAGEKTVEVRKSRPVGEEPFRVYLYESIAAHVKVGWGGKGAWADRGRGAVVAEFLCRRVDRVDRCGSGYRVRDAETAYTNQVARESCLTFDELAGYLGDRGGYAWHIEELTVYREPRALETFGRKKPPLSWGYVAGD